MSVATKQLIEDLRSEDESVRRIAAEDLGDCGDSDGVEPLVDALSDPSPAVREAATEALIRIGGERVVVHALTELRSESAAARTAACCVLKQLGEVAVPHVAQQLADDDKDVRLFAIDILAGIGSPSAEQALMATLEDRDASVAADAANALGEIHAVAAVDALIGALRANPWIRCAVARSLGQIGGPDAVRALVDLTTDEDSLVAFAAIESLAKAGDASAYACLGTQLDHSNPLVVRAAARAIRQIATRQQTDPRPDAPEVRERLRQLANSASSAIAEAAYFALIALPG